VQSLLDQQGAGGHRRIHARHARSDRQSAADARRLSGLSRADRSQRTRRRARAHAGALGHARTAAVRRCADHQHPQHFALDEDRPLAFFAGIWTIWHGRRGTKANPIEGEHQLFGFLTTDANAEVGAVHPKAMPVILTSTEAVEQWLTLPVKDALALQKPLPDGALRIVATGEKEDGLAA
jgi:hypothetical protein